MWFIRLVGMSIIFNFYKVSLGRTKSYVILLLNVTYNSNIVSLNVNHKYSTCNT